MDVSAAHLTKTTRKVAVISGSSVHAGMQYSQGVYWNIPAGTATMHKLASHTLKMAFRQFPLKVKSQGQMKE